MKRACRCLPLVLFVLVSMIQAEDVKSLADRLSSADTGSALDAPDVKPWHLKLSVQLFDEKGQPADNGTIEEWWSSPEVDRREYKTSSYTATEIRKDGKLYRTKDAGSPPYYLDLLRIQAIHPMPTSSEIEQSTPELRKVPFGKVNLECFMLSQPIKWAATIPTGLFPTYCFVKGDNSLRASYEFGQQTVLRNRLAIFQSRTVAYDIAVFSDKTKVASSQILVLEGSSLPDNEFAISDDSTEQNLSAVKVSSGMVAGNIISKPQPIYPESAKQRHISGAVIMHAIIGTDGHIHSLNLVSAPDPDLAISAIAAVRKWTYKPYMLQGVPVDVETTITVNYAFGF